MINRNTTIFLKKENIFKKKKAYIIFINFLYLYLLDKLNQFHHAHNSSHHIAQRFSAFLNRSNII